MLLRSLDFKSLQNPVGPRWAWLHGCFDRFGEGESHDTRKIDSDLAYGCFDRSRDRPASAHGASRAGRAIEAVEGIAGKQVAESTTSTGKYMRSP